MKRRQQIPIQSFSICAYICYGQGAEARFLILRRASRYLNKTWQMVSGKLEKGETGWEAALREIQEETGLKPDRLYSANLVETFYSAQDNCVNIVPVFVAILDHPQEVRLSHEHDDYRWIGAEEAQSYLVFDQQVEMIGLIQKRFMEREPNPFLKIDLS